MKKQLSYTQSVRNIYIIMRAEDSDIIGSFPKQEAEIRSEGAAEEEQAEKSLKKLYNLLKKLFTNQLSAYILHIVYKRHEICLFCDI